MTQNFVNKVADRLTASGIWLDNGSVDYEFLTAKSDVWRFWFVTSTLVAQRALAWTGERIEGCKVYELTEAGIWDQAKERATRNDRRCRDPHFPLP